MQLQDLYLLHTFCTGFTAGASAMLAVGLAAVALLKSSWRDDGCTYDQAVALFTSRSDVHGAAPSRLVSATTPASKLEASFIAVGFELAWRDAPPPPSAPPSRCATFSPYTPWQPGHVREEPAVRLLRGRVCSVCRAGEVQVSDPAALAACICAEAWQSNADPAFHAASFPCVAIAEDHKY